MSTTSDSDLREELYGSAINKLRRSDFGRDLEKFEAALDTAIYHCEQARAFDWPESELRKRIADATAGWNAASTAANKLAWHFEALDELTASSRLAFAFKKAGMQMRVEEETSEAPHLLFARFLRALGNQVARRSPTEYQIGPLRVVKPSRKLPSPETVLTVLLAHLFGRLASQANASDLKIRLGEPIFSGRAWDVAGDFSLAALARSIDSGAAKKFLHDRRGQLYYVGWPKPNTA